MSECANERERLIQEIIETELKAKELVENSFIPWDRKAKPFAEQKEFFRDTSKTKLCRTGNRAAKTFSTMRDVAWKIMRNHPYRKDWRQDYKQSSRSPKKIWICGPSFEFLREVAWEQYLCKFIPRWYYMNNEGEDNIIMSTHGQYKFIEKVYFRNGDVLEFRSYMQNLLTRMGRAVDEIVLDEMPPKLMIISELVTRVLDRGGGLTMGFTPLNPDPTIRNYLEKHPRLSTHTWPLKSNPLYGKDPEKYQRVLDEFSQLPEIEKNARLNGDWYYEHDGTDFVFQNVVPQVVDDFEVPLEWRRMIVLDPASHITGFAIFAENPSDHNWICIEAGELFWKDKLATTDDILKELERRKPSPDFKYCKMIYDNAEAWFGAHARGGWRPCIEKYKKAQIMNMRSIIVTGKLKFFAIGAAPALKQIYEYRQKAGKIVKRGDHIVDCIQYFSREIPPPVLNRTQNLVATQEDIVQCHMESLRNKWKSNGQPTQLEERALMNRRIFAGNSFSGRRAR